MLISGESGSGKTETTKIFVNYLISRQDNQLKLKNNSSKSLINYNQIKNINPLLETFGNAKTERNDNSSRFGKFLQLNFDDKNRIIKNIEIRTFLFEKSRTNIGLTSTKERTFHIFYGSGGFVLVLRFIVSSENFICIVELYKKWENGY